MAAAEVQNRVVGVQRLGLVQRVGCILFPHRQGQKDAKRDMAEFEPVIAAPDRAFDHLEHAWFGSDLAHVLVAALVGKGRVAGDHGQGAKAAELDGRLLDDTIDQEFLIRGPGPCC